MAAWDDRLAWKLFTGRCRYCGVVCRGVTCAAHADLPRLELLPVQRSVGTVDEPAGRRSSVIAALYVQTGGVYYGLDDVDPWDEKRDARLYAGPWPVVAHPPCARWCRLAPLNESMHGYKVGDDDGCFAAALAAVRTYGGVLEHPAYSYAWEAFALPVPARYGWTTSLFDEGVTSELAQVAYGHPARKRTWLYAVGCELPALDWREPEASMSVSDFGPGNTRRRGDDWQPGIQYAEASATPESFRDVLLDMARSVAKRDANVHTAACPRKSPGAV